MTIYLPDELAQEVRNHEDDMNVSAVCQEAIRKELEERKQLAQLTQEGLNRMERIEVDLWGGEDRPYRAAFRGFWLVHPDPSETRTTEEGYDAGAYWGVAYTWRGQIAVYVAHVNERWAPSLETYPTLEAAKKDVPNDILARAAGELGEDFVVELDI